MEISVNDLINKIMEAKTQLELELIKTQLLVKLQNEKIALLTEELKKKESREKDE